MVEFKQFFKIVPFLVNLFPFLSETICYSLHRLKVFKIFPQCYPFYPQWGFPTVTLILFNVTKRSQNIAKQKILTLYEIGRLGVNKCSQKILMKWYIFVRSNPSADMRFPSCPLTSMSVSILINIHTKKSSYHVIKVSAEVNRMCLITWKIIKSI